MVELLLEKGASIEVINHDNNTPLQLAIWNGHISIIEVLLKKGASMEVMDEGKEDTPAS